LIMAESAEKKVVDKNMLRFAVGGELISPEGLLWKPEGKALTEINRAIWDGVVKFNRALYHIEAPTGKELLPTEYNVLELLGKSVSYKTDLADNVKSYVGYTSEPAVISRNELTRPVIKSFTLKQDTSELTVTGSVVQAKDEIVSYRISNAAITNVSYPVAAASGDVFMTPVVTYSGKRTPVYASGKDASSEATNWGGTTSDFLDIDGELLVSGIGATFDPNTGVVYAPYLGDTPSARRPIARLTYVAIDTDNGTMYWRGTAEAIQQANQNGLSSSSYSPSSSLNSTSNVGTEGGIREITVSSVRKNVYKWSSGAPGGTSTENETLYLSASIGTLSKSSLSGNASAEWTIPANDSNEDREITLRVYHGNTSLYNKTYELTQTGAVFSKWVYWKVKSVSAGYEQIPAGGGTVTPHVSVTVLYYAEYTDGTAHYDETTEDAYSGVSVSAATAPNAPSVSGVTFNSKTGAVYAPSLEQTESPTRGVFYVGSLSGSFVESISNKTVEWSWSEGASIEQAENYRHDYGDAYMEYKSSVSTEELLAYDTSFVVYTTARQCQDYYWDSDPVDIGTDYTDATLSVMVNRNTGDVRTLTGANKSTTFKVGANTSTTEEKTFLVEVYSSDNEYYEQFYVVQAVNHVQWAAPVINGTLTVSNISAKGGSVSVLVPIIQKQYDSGGNVVATHTESVYASAVGGTPSNGGSVSGGIISAPNLGQTATSERTVFTITSVTVKSTKTNTSYTINVSPSVTVKQNANYQWWERSRYNVSITPQGTIPALGGSAKLLVNAYEWVQYYWASAPDTPTNETGFSMNGYVTSVQGTITGSPTVGTGKQVTLTYNVENDMLYQKGISVSLTAKSTVGLDDISVSTVVYQEPTKYVFVKDNNLYGVGTDGGLVTLFYTSTKNGYAYPISKSVFKLSDTTNMAFEGDSTLVGDTVGHYKINVRIQPNSGAARTFSVTANHPVDPNASIVWNIDQMGVGLKKAWFSGTFKFGVSLAGGNNYNIINVSNPAMSAVGDAYGGGTLTNLFFKVVNISTGEVYTTSNTISSLSVQNNNTASISLRALSNPSGLANVQVDMWYDGEYQDSYMIAANPESQSEE